MFPPKTVTGVLLAPREEPRNILESGFFHHTLLTPCPVAPGVLPSSLPGTWLEKDSAAVSLGSCTSIFQVCRMIWNTAIHVAYPLSCSLYFPRFSQSSGCQERCHPLQPCLVIAANPKFPLCSLLGPWELTDFHPVNGSSFTEARASMGILCPRSHGISGGRRDACRHSHCHSTPIENISEERKMRFQQV